MDKIAIVFLSLYFPEGSGGNTFRKKLLNILTSIDGLGKIICLNADNKLRKMELEKLQVVTVGEHKEGPKYIKFFWYCIIQMKSLFKLISLRNDYSEIIVMTGNNFAIPILFMKKLFDKKIIYLLSGVAGVGAYRYCRIDNKRLSFFAALGEEISMMLSDAIVLESPRLKKILNLEKYNYKLFQNGHLYIDLKKYKITSPLVNRENKIGYIGRLSPEKGVENLLKGIVVILSHYPNLKIFIAGKGPLENKVRDMAEKYPNIEYLGFLPDEKLPWFFNKLKLLIVPSAYNGTEGVPNVIAESMACGTPVLATKTGGIPDIISDGETGFLMDDNHPTTIANNIMKILECDYIDEISIAARNFVEKEFSFTSIRDRYEKIIKKV